MTAMTDAQTWWVKSVLGTGADLQDVQARVDRLGNIRDAALEVLRQRYADLLQQPGTISVSGVASMSTSANLTALASLIATVKALPEDPTAPTTDTGSGPIIRPGSGWERPRRRPTTVWR